MEERVLDQSVFKELADNKINATNEKKRMFLEW